LKKFDKHVLYEMKTRFDELTLNPFVQIFKIWSPGRTPEANKNLHRATLIFMSFTVQTRIKSVSQAVTKKIECQNSQCDH